MHTGTNSPAYPGMALWSQARGPARNRPCSRACTQTGTDAASHAGMEPPAKTAVRKARCPLGFSEMQIAILSLLKAQPALIAYWQIAEAIARVYGIGSTEGAVRGALERLGRRGFLVRSRRRQGARQPLCVFGRSMPAHHAAMLYGTGHGGVHGTGRGFRHKIRAISS